MSAVQLLYDFKNKCASNLEHLQQWCKWHHCKLESIMLQICSLCFLAFPKFQPIVLIFMLSRYALCRQFIFIIVNFCIKMIMIGIKWSYKSNCNIKFSYKCIKIDVNASICSNLNSYWTVISSIYIPHLQSII